MPKFMKTQQFKKKYMPKLWDIPICARGSGKTILNTQRSGVNIAEKKNRRAKETMMDEEEG